jgi:protein-ribulosamine 3-kinase
MKDHGKGQLEGEYHGMLELYKTAPHMVPKPHGWGKIESVDIPTYFYVCDFIDISDALPDPVKLDELVADLHKRSISPTGKFGFHLPTYDGWQPQEVEWDSSWTSFFAKLLAKAWQTDFEVNGHWDALDTAMEQTLKDVIPRLIGVLESNGRTVKPCLIHGDLWEGNIGTDLETGDIYIYDAAVFYAHNEMEMGMWRVQHHQMKAKVYRKEYIKHFKKSEPVEEWDDRICLYGVKTKLMYSVAVPNGAPIRQQWVILY